jgi:pseudaminic acid synthase
MHFAIIKAQMNYLKKLKNPLMTYRKVLFSQVYGQKNKKIEYIILDWSSMSCNYQEKIQSNSTYIIAEMSANHAGKIEYAKEIINAAKEAGADCVKIQTYTPDTMTIDCNNKYFEITEGTWKRENLYSLYQKAFTPWEWHKELMDEAKNIGLDFFSTPFDKTSVDFLESIGVEFYKVASFELVDIPLIDYIASKNKPIIMSTGMATLGEIEDAVNTVRKHHNHLALLKCSSAYPAITDQMNLKTMVNMGDIFQLPVGLSDHSMGSIGAVTAVALGAKIIEKHFCISRTINNPDASFSMEPLEFKNMVEDIRSAEKAFGKIVYGPSENEKINKNFRRSIFVVEDIDKGDLITEKNIRVIRPGYGLAPKYYNQVLGQYANKDIKRGTPLQLEDIGR